MIEPVQIFAFLFLMLGPFKMIVPFTRITRGADVKLTNQIAIRAFIFSTIALLLAGLLGENIITKFGIPLPILALSAGIILFMVALLNILQQYNPSDKPVENSEPPKLSMAMSPLAFPSIVTPYGIAAVIVFLALTPDLNGKITIWIIVLGIMVINLIFMLINRYIYKTLAVILPILGSIIGIIQVALGLKIIYNSFIELMKQT